MIKRIQEVKDHSLDRLVQSERLVLVDFWAPWCGPCRALGPILEDVARDWANRIRLVKINVDDNPSSAARFSVRAIPTLILFKNGEEVGRLLGAVRKAEIESRLNQHFDAGSLEEERHGNAAL